MKLAPVSYMFGLSETAERKVIALKRIDGHAGSSPELDFSNTAVHIFSPSLTQTVEQETQMSVELKKLILQWQDMFYPNFRTILLLQKFTRYIQPDLTPFENFTAVEAMKNPFNGNPLFSERELNFIRPYFLNADTPESLIDKIWTDFKIATLKIRDSSLVWLQIYSKYIEEMEYYSTQTDIRSINDAFIQIVKALENSMYWVENPQRLLTSYDQVSAFLQFWYKNALARFQRYKTKTDLRKIIHQKNSYLLTKESFRFKINPIVMESILYNFLGNAIRYMNSDDPYVLMVTDVIHDPVSGYKLKMTFKNTVSSPDDPSPLKNPTTEVNGRKLGFHYSFTTRGTGVGLSEIYHTARQFGYEVDIYFEADARRGNLFVGEVLIPIEKENNLAGLLFDTSA